MRSGEHALWDAAVWEVEMAWLVSTGPTMLEAMVEWDRAFRECVQAAMLRMVPAMEAMARALARLDESP